MAIIRLDCGICENYGHETLWDTGFWTNKYNLSVKWWSFFNCHLNLRSLWIGSVVLFLQLYSKVTSMLFRGCIAVRMMIVNTAIPDRAEGRWSCSRLLRPPRHPMSITWPAVLSLAPVGTDKITLITQYGDKTLFWSVAFLLKSSRHMGLS